MAAKFQSNGNSISSMDAIYDDLPPISVNTPDSGRFEMPEANVLASQRLLESTQDNEIKRMRAEIAAAVVGDESESDGELATCLDALRVEPPAPVLHENPGLCPTSIDILKPALTPMHYNFLESFVKCLRHSNAINLDRVLEDILISVESTLFKDKVVQADVLSLFVALSLICITQACRSVPRHLPPARRLLYYLLDELHLEIPQVEEMGIISMTIVQDPKDRLELATILDSGDGENSTTLSRGIVRMSLKELLSVDKNISRYKWNSTPFTPTELLSQVSKVWRRFNTKKQLVVTHLVSRNLLQLENLPDVEVDNRLQAMNEERSAITDLLLLLTNVSHGQKDAEKLKLQVLVSKMKLLQGSTRPSHTKRHSYMCVGEDRDGY